MRQTLHFRGLSPHPKVIGNFLVASIHHHRRHFPGGVYKSGGRERAPARRSGYPLSAGAYEFGKMADVIERVRIDEAARLRVGVERREAKIVNVIGPARLVQKDVPVRPSLRAVI